MSRSLLPRLLGIVSVLALALMLPLSASGCGEGAGRGGVVATTTMLGDVVDRLLDGTGVRSATLIRPGIDPHTYELKGTDAKRLESADLVVYNGLGLEGKLGQALQSLGDRAVAAGEFVPEEKRLSAEDFEGAYDPHVWMDVELWARHVVGGVAKALAEKYPDHATKIRLNAEELEIDLVALDGYVRQTIGLIPEPARKLVTAHDAFGYFGRAYGIEVRGVQGISTVDEAAAKDIAELVDYIAEHQLPAVFVESSVSDKPVLKIIEEARKRGVDVKLGPALFSDSTGPAGQYEGTYAGMIDHNATIIAVNLGAPGVDVHGFGRKLMMGHDHSAHEKAPGHENCEHGHEGHDHGHEGHDHGDHEGHNH